MNLSKYSKARIQTKSNCNEIMIKNMVNEYICRNDVLNSMDIAY